MDTTQYNDRPSLHINTGASMSSSATTTSTSEFNRQSNRNFSRSKTDGFYDDEGEEEGMPQAPTLPPRLETTSEAVFAKLDTIKKLQAEISKDHATLEGLIGNDKSMAADAIDQSFETRQQGILNISHKLSELSDQVKEFHNMPPPLPIPNDSYFASSRGQNKVSTEPEKQSNNPKIAPRDLFASPPLFTTTMSSSGGSNSSHHRRPSSPLRQSKPMPTLQNVNESADQKKFSEP